MNLMFTEHASCWKYDREKNTGMGVSALWLLILQWFDV